MGVGRQVDLRNLAERIRAIEQRQGAAAVPAEADFIDPPLKDRIPTAWPEIDNALGGGLIAGGLHEWFGVVGATGDESRKTSTRSSSGRWSPPLCILVHLAWQTLHHQPSSPWTVWIGRCCHPYPRVVIRDDGRDRRLLDRSLFVAPRTADARLWAIDLAIRSPAVGLVVADGSGLDRAATQRLQLLGATHGKSVLAACPPGQQDHLSAAQTRWLVSLYPSSKETRGGIQPRWIVELLRCKGMRPTGAACKWLLEWNRGEGAVDLSARLADLAGPPEKQVFPVQRIRSQSRTA